MRNRRLWIACAAVGLATAGCGRSAPGIAPPKPRVVTVELPALEDTTDFAEFTGRTEAVFSNNVRARVTGYLEKVFFKDGDTIKKGDLLFLIDPRTYQADYDRAQATLAQARARLKRLDADYRRAVNLAEHRAISREEFDKIDGDHSEAAAAVQNAQANLNLSALNLDFTKVKAEIDGLLSRRMVDPGNLVKADDTVLTSIVSFDPLYVYFDVDEHTTLRIQRMIREGRLPNYDKGELAVAVGLADDDKVFPLKGKLNFSENQLDSATGTLRVRVSIPNMEPRILSPGMFVRVRFPVGAPHKAIAVDDKAIGTDQGRRFVYIVNSKNEVEYRGVELGNYTEGGKRVIESGIAPGDRVMIGNLQQVRPGEAVVVGAVESDGRAPAVSKKAQGPPQAVVVKYRKPVVESVIDFEDFIGQTQGVYTVSSRARVSGYLDRVYFRDGDMVKKGDLMFLIDPRTYQADLDRAEAALAQAKARFDRLEKDYQRARSLAERGALSPQDFDLVDGDHAEAAAGLQIAQANVDLAKLNLGFTKVEAEISGRLSRRLVDPGNLVRADDTILTTIVSLDPMYVYFDVDERTLLKLRRLRQKGRFKTYQQEDKKVYVGLADEDDYPHLGRIDFRDNKLDPNTGTIRVRAILPNSEPRVFHPGMFVKVRLPTSAERNALMIDEEAIGTDQGKKYVWIIKDAPDSADPKKIVSQAVRKDIEFGALRDGMREVKSGVGAEDRVIVQGLQRLRPGVRVEPQLLNRTRVKPAAAKSATTVEDSTVKPAKDADSTSG
jgi:RND family efflux transporter MFP subunit